MKRRTSTIELELQEETKRVPSYSTMLAMQPVVALTVLHHPRLGRVGDRVRLPMLSEAGGRVEVSRLGPELHPPGTTAGLPLATSFLSRRPIVLSRTPDGAIMIDGSEGGTHLVVDGASVDDRIVVPRARVTDGVVLELGRQIVLLLHQLEGHEEPSAATLGDDHGLAGASDAIRFVRDAIGRVGKLSGAVLVRGETGTGKELVARALHEASARKDKPYVAVNMAAVPPTLAASELFGHAKGAFSGAHQANLGMFGRADGGTLFMDEIGDTPLDVQAALLRVLETGEVQQVGADRVKTVDVRLIAATDADLELAVQAGRFRAPLRYRLASQEVRLPKLAARRDDIGRLLVHLVAQELTAQGRAEELWDMTPDGASWIPGPLVARLARAPWPGNVRQLKNVARWLASLDHRGRAVMADDPALDGLVDDGGAGPSAATPDDDAPLAPYVPPAAASAGGRVATRATVDGIKRPRRAIGDIGHDELERLMIQHAYKLGNVADELGISRPALNELVDAHPRLRRAQSLTRDEIVQALDAAGGDIGQVWQALRVSEKSLKLRMSALGLLTS
ncbi:MAG: sigma-54-dependent Fis family transcriptional regulator [Deltaproteobacteria bacterium]|nr:sigma-54-dependent Fis family transcriptional regulator [Deltaproteobacteria bacterium]